MIHARRLWEYGSKMGKMWWRISSTSFHFIGIFVTDMQLTTTTTSGMNCHQLNIHVWLIGGSVGHLFSFFPSQRLMNFWFYATLYTVGCAGKKCLRYWSFFGSWRKKLLTIYALGNGGGGVRSCQNPFICWWLYQGTREDIRIRGVFLLQKLPINSKAEALNTEIKGPILYAPQECGYTLFVMFVMF